MKGQRGGWLSKRRSGLAAIWQGWQEQEQELELGAALACCDGDKRCKVEEATVKKFIQIQWKGGWQGVKGDEGQREGATEKGLKVRHFI